MSWPVQDAKQRFSEVLRRAHAEGPQVVTRHGDEVAVVIDIREYRHLRGGEADFKDFLTSAGGPFLDDIVDELADCRHRTDLPREPSLGES